MLIFNHAKQEVNKKLVRLCLAFELALSESIRYLQGDPQLSMKQIPIDQSRRRYPNRYRR